MTLRNDIEKFQKEFIPQLPAETIETLMATTKNLVQAGLTENALSVGDKIPLFSLPNAKGKLIASRKLLGKGPLVISFYRGSWCPYCNLELKALQDALPEIKNLGAKLVAISPQCPDKSLPTSEVNSLTFEVLSDEGNKVAQKFGLVYKLADELRTIYPTFGIDLVDSNGDASFELPFPATYVVDTDGTIIHAFVDADYTKRLEPAEIIKVLRTRQADRETTDVSDHLQFRNIDSGPYSNW